MVLFGVGRAFVGLSDSMQLASSRLRLVTRDAEDFEGAFSGLFQIAQEARTPLLGVINLYARVGRATAQFGLTNQQILPFVRALNQAIAVSGATAQEAEAGLIQLSQGLAAGALRGDEFRSVKRTAPPDNGGRGNQLGDNQRRTAGSRNRGRSYDRRCL